MDIATTGYLAAPAFLLLLLSVWIPSRLLQYPLAIWFWIGSTIVATIAVVDASLYAYWGFKLDATIFTYLDSPSLALASATTGYLVVRGMLILFLTILLGTRLTQFSIKALPTIVGIKPKAITTLALLMAGGLIFLGIRGGVGKSTMNIGYAFWSDNLLLNHTTVNPSFSLFASLGKQQDFGNEYRLLPQEECDVLFERLYPKEKVAEVDSLTKLLHTTRPNILLLILEGFGAELIEPLGGIAGVTPELNALSEEGIFFTRTYATSFRTDRGLVSILSGHTSYPSASIMKLPTKLQRLPSLARTLSQGGYTTDFYYGGDINFTNTQGYLRTMGYSHIVGDTHFTEAERRTNAWGVNDDIMFDYLYKELSGRAATDRPWHTAFLTLSSHEPFEVPYSRLDDKKLNAFAYTDHCLGAFVEQLKSSPLWDNLLMILIPDHSVRYRLASEDPEFYHIPMLWLGGAVKAPCRVERLMSQSDLAATLLGQLDLPHNDFRYSRNVVSPNYSYPFAYGSSGNTILFADSTGTTLYGLDAKQVICDTPSPSNERLQQAKAILQGSYDELGQP